MHTNYEAYHMDIFLENYKMQDSYIHCTIYLKQVKFRIAAVKLILNASPINI